MTQILAIFCGALLIGCAATPKVNDCADQMVNLYGDLGAESSSGYEDMPGSDAHFEGIKWAAEFMKSCAE